MSQVISLFSGAGGCSLGFAQAGVAASFAADIDRDAAATYSANLGVECRVLDLSTPSAIQAVHQAAGALRPLMLVGGPPCQGFSTAGPRNSNDPRNALIFNYLALVERLQPRWFIFENVEGILTSNSGRDIVSLVSELAGLGYTIRLEKLNFAGFGLPQTRKRVLIVGNRMGLRFSLPQSTFAFDSGKAKLRGNLPFAPTVADAIDDLPPASAYDKTLNYELDVVPSDYARSLRADVVRHHSAAPKADLVDLVARLAPGQTMKDLPELLQHESFRRRANRRVSDGVATERRGGAPAGYKRLRGELNSLTITSAAPREFIHPRFDRPLTLRECARLQSFPDCFDFSGNGMSIARQIGNAIPPLAAKVLANALLAQEGAAGGTSGPSCVDARPGLLGYRLTDASAMSPALAATDAGLRALTDGATPSLPEFDLAAANA